MDSAFSQASCPPGTSFTFLLELTLAVNVSLLHILENTESLVWFKS